MILAAGCTGGQSENIDVTVPAGMQLASDKAAYFNFFVPSEWKVDTSAGSACAYVSELDASNVSAVRISVPDASVTTAELYWDTYKNDFSESFTNFTVISENEKTTLYGKDACKYVYTASLTGQSYKYCSVICVFDGSVYMLTYTSSPDKYDSHTEEFTSICNNFMIKSGISD